MAAASEAVDQTCSTGTAKSQRSSCSYSTLLLPAWCPALWVQRFKPLLEFPSARLSISGGRQVGRVHHPTAAATQLLMKGNAFTWRNVNLTKPPCSVLSNKTCSARWYTQVVYRRSEMQAGPSCCRTQEQVSVQQQVFQLPLLTNISLGCWKAENNWADLPLDAPLLRHIVGHHKGLPLLPCPGTASTCSDSRNLKLGALLSLQWWNHATSSFCLQKKHLP